MAGLSANPTIELDNIQGVPARETVITQLKRWHAIPKLILTICITSELITTMQLTYLLSFKLIQLNFFFKYNLFIIKIILLFS